MGVRGSGFFLHFKLGDKSAFVLDDFVYFTTSSYSYKSPQFPAIPLPPLILLPLLFHTIRRTMFKMSPLRRRLFCTAQKKKRIKK